MRPRKRPDDYSETDWKEREYSKNAKTLGVYGQALHSVYGKGKTTNVPWIDALAAIGDVYLKNRPGLEQIDNAAAIGALFGMRNRERAKLERALEARLERRLTPSELEEIETFQVRIEQEMIEGKSPEQAASDILNELGYLGPLGDHSSDDADSQPAWTEGGDADVEPQPNMENKTGSWGGGTPGLEDLPFVSAPMDRPGAPQQAPGLEDLPFLSTPAGRPGTPQGAPAEPDETPESGAPAPADAGAASQSPRASRRASRLRPAERAQLEALTREVAAPAHAVETILLKPAESWTHEELRTVMASEAYWTKAGDRPSPERAGVKRWFDHVYTTGPVQRDASGRMRQPEPVRPAPETPQPPRDADGAALTAGLGQLAEALTEAAETLGFPTAVRGLQRGLNRLDPPDRSGRAPLKADGDLGPKTRAAVRRAAAQRGGDGLARSLAVGGLEEEGALARRTPDGPAADAEAGSRLDAWSRAAERMAAASDLAQGRDPARAKGAVARTVQRGLGGLLEAEGEPALRRDGLLGPKSGGAFRIAARRRPRETADGLARAFGLLR